MTSRSHSEGRLGLYPRKHDGIMLRLKLALLVTVAHLLLACAPPRPEPRRDATPPAEAEKGLLLHTRGEAPHRPLRLQREVGMREQLRMRVDAAMTVRAGGALNDLGFTSHEDPKPVELDVELVVTDVREGSAHQAITIRHGHHVVRGEMVVSDRGVIERLELEPLEDEVGALGPGGLEASLRRLIIPLPQQAVGAGARWTAFPTTSMNGLPVRESATYELVEIEDDTLVVDVSLQRRVDPERPPVLAGLPGLRPDAIRAMELSWQAHGQIALTLDRLAPTRASRDAAIALVAAVDAPEAMSLDLDADVRWQITP